MVWLFAMIAAVLNLGVVDASIFASFHSSEVDLPYRVSFDGILQLVTIVVSVTWTYLEFAWNRYAATCDYLLASAAVWLAHHGIRFVLDYAAYLRVWFAVASFGGLLFVLFTLAKHVRRLYGEGRAYLRARSFTGIALPLAPLLVEASDVRIVPSDGENGICLEVAVDGMPVRVALNPIQAVALLATSLPQNQSRGKEMAIPGKVPLTVAKLPNGVVSLRVGAQVVGMGFRMSFNRSTYLVTATHVLDNARAYELLIESGGKTHPLERGWKVALRSRPSQLDISFVSVPGAVWSVLGVKSLELGAVSSQVVQAVKVYGFSKLGRPQMDFGSAVALKTQLFSLTHTAWTQPSYSGSPLLSDGRVIAVHTGAVPSGPAGNKATSLACLLTFLRKETEWKGDAWSEVASDEFDKIAQQNARADEMEALVELEHQFDDEEAAITTRMRSRGFEYSRDDVALVARGIRRWADEDEDETIPDPDKTWEEFRDLDEQSHVNTTRKRGPVVEPIETVVADPHRAPKTPKLMDMSEMILPTLTNVEATRVVPLPPAPLKRAVPLKALPLIPVRARESALVKPQCDRVSNLRRKSCQEMLPCVRPDVRKALPPPPTKRSPIIELIERGKESLNSIGPGSEATGPQISNSSETSEIMFGSMKSCHLVPPAGSDLKKLDTAVEGSQEAVAKRKRRQRNNRKN